MTNLLTSSPILNFTLFEVEEGADDDDDNDGIEAKFGVEVEVV